MVSTREFSLNFSVCCALVSGSLGMGSLALRICTFTTSFGEPRLEFY